MTKKHRVSSLLKRFQFIDLSAAVSRNGPEREAFLRKYLDRAGGPFSTYEPFRKATSSIYGVTLGLDPSPASDWPKIEEAIRRVCKGKDEGMNLDAARALFDLLRPIDFNAFPHPVKSLSLGVDRASSFRIEHYIVRDEQLVFQFPYPRRTRLTDYEYRVMASLMHYGYAVGDYSDALIEIADLSPIEREVVVRGRRENAPRSPRVLQYKVSDIISRDELQSDIQDVYRILMNIAEEPDA